MRRLNRTLASLLLPLAVARAFQPTHPDVHIAARGSFAALIARRSTTTSSTSFSSSSSSSSGWTENAMEDEAGARIWLPSASSKALGAEGRLGTTTVSPEIFRPGNWWCWSYVDAETGAAVAEERYTVAEAEAGGAEGDAATRLKMDIAGRSAGSDAWVTHHRIDMDLADALEAHDDPDDEPHWDFRGYYRRAEDGEEAASDAGGGGLSWVRTRGASDTRDLFESRFNLLRVREAGDPNFRLERRAGAWATGSGSNSEAAMAAASAVGEGSGGGGGGGGGGRGQAGGRVDATLFSTTRIDGEEWVKSNGEEMWCTHRAWRDTHAWQLQCLRRLSLADADNGDDAAAGGDGAATAGHPLGGVTVRIEKGVKLPAALAAASSSSPSSSSSSSSSSPSKGPKLALELRSWFMEGLSESSSSSSSGSGGSGDSEAGSGGGATEDLLQQARELGMTGNAAVDELVEGEAAAQAELEEALAVLETQKMLAEELGYASVKELEAAMDEIENGVGLEAFLAEIEAGDDSDDDE